MTGCIVECTMISAPFANFSTCSDVELVRGGAGRKAALAELINEPWIHMPPDNPLGSPIAEAFRSQNLEVPKESVSSFSMHLRIHLLSTGRFLTIVPDSMLRFNAERWSLKALPIDLSIRRRLGAIITLKHRMLSPVAQLFLDHTREIARSMSSRTESRHRVPQSAGSLL